MYTDENIKTIRFPVKTDDKLQSLANKCGLTKLKLFIAMVDYFYKTKKDPRDLNDELLKNAIHKKTDNIIAFIRTQETELLVPVKKDTERMLLAQENIINFFNSHIIGHNAEQQKIAQKQSAQLSSILELVSKQDTRQYDKALLKRRFAALLEHYIKSREQMGVLSKQSEKDDLARLVRQQLEDL